MLHLIVDRQDIEKPHQECKNLFELCSNNSNAHLVRGYVNCRRELLGYKQILNFAKIFYIKIDINKFKNYKHSMNENGSTQKVEEFVMICR